MWPLWMWVGVALAQDESVSEPVDSTSDAPTRATVGEVALAVTLPSGGLGIGGGLQGTVAFPLGERVELGPALVLRTPTAAAGELVDPAVATSLDWETRLTSVALAARAAWRVPVAEDWTGRVALEAGVAALSQRTEGGAGVTVERVPTLWISPRLGILRAVGPGQLTFDMAYHVAPETLLVTGGNVGGTGLSLVVGYRVPT